jgi:hypothetical protein
MAETAVAAVLSVADRPWSASLSPPRPLTLLLRRGLAVVAAAAAAAVRVSVPIDVRLPECEAHRLDGLEWAWEQHGRGPWKATEVERDSR